MNEIDTEALANALARLIREDVEVRSAIWQCVCLCPNLVVQY